MRQPILLPKLLERGAHEHEIHMSCRLKQLAYCSASTKHRAVGPAKLYVLGNQCPSRRIVLEAGLDTILTLSGVTTREDTERFPYRPSRIIESVADLIDELGSA